MSDPTECGSERENYISLGALRCGDLKCCRHSNGTPWGWTTTLCWSWTAGPPPTTSRRREGPPASERPLGRGGAGGWRWEWGSPVSGCPWPSPVPHHGDWEQGKGSGSCAGQPGLDEGMGCLLSPSVGLEGPRR